MPQNERKNLFILQELESAKILKRDARNQCERIFEIVRRFADHPSPFTKRKRLPHHHPKYRSIDSRHFPSPILRETRNTSPGSRGIRKSKFRKDHPSQLSGTPPLIPFPMECALGKNSEDTHRMRKRKYPHPSPLLSFFRRRYSRRGNPSIDRLRKRQ